MKKFIVLLFVFFISCISSNARVQKLENYKCIINSKHDKQTIVMCNNKFGVYHNETSRFIIEPNYDDIYKFQHNWYYIITLSEKKGLTTYEGIELLPPKYKNISLDSTSYKDRLKIQTEDNYYGIYSTVDKNFIIQPQYEIINSINTQNNEFYYDVKRENEHKILKSNGEEFYKFENFARPLKNLTYIIKINNKYGIFDLENKNFILKPEFDEFYTLNNKLIEIVKANHHGLITSDGNVILNPEFEMIDINFFDYYIDRSKILVKKQEKFGIYNTKTQEYFLPPESDKIQYRRLKTSESDKYKNIIFEVYKAGKVQLLDENGKEIPGCKFDSIYTPFDNDDTLSGDMLFVEYNNKFGIYNLNSNKYLLEPQFDSLNILKNNNRYIKIGQNDKFGIYDKNKDTLSEFVYDDISLNKLNELVVTKNNNKNLYTPVASTLKTTGYIISWLPIKTYKIIELIVINGMCIFVMSIAG